jgi:hypothetical protein
VVRDLINKERGSILIALGPLYFRRHGMHVGVGVKENGGYRKFEIDNLLGRLTCPQEPRLLYTKALLHAVTSFALPDPLTACTGTEEAYHILRSGYCQSWTPVISANKSILGRDCGAEPSSRVLSKGQEASTNGAMEHGFDDNDSTRLLQANC